MKKEIIKVRKGRFGSEYAFDGAVAFALATKPYVTNKAKRKQATYFYICRDWINDDLISFVNGGNRDVGRVDMTRLRLLIAAYKHKEKRIFTAKRIINTYEELAGFKERSKIVLTKYDGCGTVWMLTGPKEWMICSQLVSMLTLIIRIVWRSTQPKEITPGVSIDDVKGLEQYWKELIDDAKGDNFLTNTDVSTYLPICYPKWRMMMENFSDLFDLTAEEAYPMASVGHWHVSGGIYELCKFNSTIGKLDEKMKKLWKGKYRGRYKDA